MSTKSDGCRPFHIEYVLKIARKNAAMQTLAPLITNYKAYFSFPVCVENHCGKVNMKTPTKWDARVLTTTNNKKKKIKLTNSNWICSWHFEWHEELQNSRLIIAWQQCNNNIVRSKVRNDGAIIIFCSV